MLSYYREYGKYVYDALDEWLDDYTIIDKKIRLRKEELQFRHRETDLNSHIKSSMPNNPTEAIISNWDSDIRLQSLYVVKGSIDATLEALDEQLTEIFLKRWQEKQTWEEIAHYMNINPKHLESKRKYILEIFGRFRGML